MVEEWGFICVNTHCSRGIASTVESSVGTLPCTTGVDTGNSGTGGNEKSNQRGNA